MNFLEAVTAMKEGKKVRLNNTLYELDTNNVIKQETSKGFEYSIFGVSAFEADDWEIFEESWTLSEREIKDAFILDIPFEGYEKEDVVEFVKRLKQIFPALMWDGKRDIKVHDEIDELAGDELIRSESREKN